MGDYVFRIQNQVISILQHGAETDPYTEERQVISMREWEYNKENLNEAIRMFEELIELHLKTEEAVRRLFES